MTAGKSGQNSMVKSIVSANRGTTCFQFCFMSLVGYSMSIIMDVLYRLFMKLVFSDFMNFKTVPPGCFSVFHRQPGWEAYFTKANSQGENGVGIQVLRRLGLRGKSVASMRECLGVLVGVKP